MQFSNTDLVAFMEGLGVPIELERSGRFFPWEIGQKISRWP